MDRKLYLCAAIAGFTGVALGAFGAHALAGNISADMSKAFETGARYQMYHAFALCAAAWGWARWQSRLFAVAGWCFVTGIVLFPGSLYLMAATGTKWLGIVTPFGGLAFLTGWACLGFGAHRATR